MCSAFSTSIPLDQPCGKALSRKLLGTGLTDMALKGVWRAQDMTRDERVCSSGYPALDADLPGGGWPLGAMVEVLQPNATQHVWQLLAPALAQQIQTGPAGQAVVLIGAPAMPFGPGLAARGVDPQRLLCVQAEGLAQRLWVAEQALRCADVAAVLVWLPCTSSARGAERGSSANLQMQLRRLQIAVPPHGLLFALRPLAAQAEVSCARLRLGVQADGAADCLQVQILKRRGPPPLLPVELPPHPQRLADLLAVRHQPLSMPSTPSAPLPLPQSAPAQGQRFARPYVNIPARTLDSAVAA
jgi:protein ImuA